MAFSKDRFDKMRNLTMAVLYAAAGICLIFVIHFDFLPKTNQIGIGAVLLLYGIYRGYKLYRTRDEE